MIRTLQAYLGKDLVKATVLAAVAFTLVMTIFAALQRLHEYGLSSAQAMKLFGYCLPLMFSLTLPFAALFAATIVYGRFGQDNELMACRASGICTLTLLKPAIYLGVIVTGLTLGLTLYVAPSLWVSIERTAKHNAEQITYHGLKSRNCFRIPDRHMLFHADDVDPQTGWVEGPILLDYSDPQNAWCWTAASAHLEFHQQAHRTFVVFHWTDPAWSSQMRGSEWGGHAQPIRYAELPGFPQGEPRLYGWNKLWKTWRRPEENRLVRDELEKMKREVLIGMFYRDLVAALESTREHDDGPRYDKLIGLHGADGTARPKRLWLTAEGWRLHKGKHVWLGSDAAAAASAQSGAAQRPVVVTELESGRQYHARGARVEGIWPEYEAEPKVSLALEDVEVRLPGLSEGPIQESLLLGPYAIPAELVTKVKDVQTADMVRDPKAAAALPGMAGRIQGLRQNTIRKLLAKVRAEIHLRTSYGVSCFLMVMLGAALGLLWRGGQVLAAFAISASVAAGVITMIFMGRELIRNINVPGGYGYGVTVIWGGIALLAAAVATVYAGPLRR